MKSLLQVNSRQKFLPSGVLYFNKTLYSTKQKQNYLLIIINDDSHFIIKCCRMVVGRYIYIVILVIIYNIHPYCKLYYIVHTILFMQGVAKKRLQSDTVFCGIIWLWFMHNMCFMYDCILCMTVFYVWLCFPIDRNSPARLGGNFGFPEEIFGEYFILSYHFTLIISTFWQEIGRNLKILYSNKFYKIKLFDNYFTLILIYINYITTCLQSPVYMLNEYCTKVLTVRVRNVLY